MSTESLAVQQTSILEIISRVASDPKVDPGKLKDLLEIQERVMIREGEIAFNAALSRLQPKLPRIQQDGKIEFKGKVQSTYAKYETIDAIIRPLLQEEGFSLSFDSGSSDEKGMMLWRGTLSHKMGYSRTSSILLPADPSGSKNGIQAIGSTASYAKRYLVGMLLNIVTVGQDDDAQAAGAINDVQAQTITEMLSKLPEERQARFLSHFKVVTVADIQARDYNNAVTMLRQAERSMK